MNKYVLILAVSMVSQITLAQEANPNLDLNALKESAFSKYGAISSPVSAALLGSSLERVPKVAGIEGIIAQYTQGYNEQGKAEGTINFQVPIYSFFQNPSWNNYRKNYGYKVLYDSQLSVSSVVTDGVQHQAIGWQSILYDSQIAKVFDLYKKEIDKNKDKIEMRQKALSVGEITFEQYLKEGENDAKKLQDEINKIQVSPWRSALAVGYGVELNARNVETKAIDKKARQQVAWVTGTVNLGDLIPSKSESDVDKAKVEPTQWLITGHIRHYNKLDNADSSESNESILYGVNLHVGSEYRGVTGIAEYSIEDLKNSADNKKKYRRMIGLETNLGKIFSGKSSALSDSYFTIGYVNNTGEKGQDAIMGKLSYAFGPKPILGVVAEAPKPDDKPDNPAPKDNANNSYGQEAAAKPAI